MQASQRQIQAKIMEVICHDFFIHLDYIMTTKGERRIGDRSGERLAYDDTKDMKKPASKSTMERKTTKKGNARKTMPVGSRLAYDGKKGSSKAGTSKAGTDWIDGALNDKKAGVFSRKAKRAGMTTRAYAAKVIKDLEGKTKTAAERTLLRQAVLARTLIGMKK